jgi:hypothetical protein
MPLPPQVEQWARKNYPRPAIDPVRVGGSLAQVASLMRALGLARWLLHVRRGGAVSRRKHSEQPGTYPGERRDSAPRLRPPRQHDPVHRPSTCVPHL